MNGNGKRALAAAAAIVVIFLGVVFQQIRDTRVELAGARALCHQRYEQTLEIRGDLKEIRAELRALRGEIGALREDVGEVRDAVGR